MLIPQGPEFLTDEWLTSALQAYGTITPTTHVTSFRTALLPETKGVTGQLARVTLDFDAPEASAPRTLIAKFSAADPSIRTSVHTLGFYVREVNFYQRLADRVELRTPRCYYSALDPETGLCVLLLEDLAPARNGDSMAGCSLTQVESAVAAIATFHATWWDNPELTGMDWLNQPSEVAIRRTEETYSQIWSAFVHLQGAKLQSALTSIGERLGSHFGWLMQRLTEPPVTLVHLDYNPDNLFFATDGSDRLIAVVDWQMIGRYRGAYDVAHFLVNSVEPESRKAWELNLLQMYHSILIDKGVLGYSFDDALYDYRLSMLYRLYRVVFILGAVELPADQRALFSDVALPRISAAILDLNVGELTK
ncbi:MAG: phosphotransferase [Anaerolineae bacterium]|nr:phosphotransferase [Anaerolineae bacterium]